MSELEQKKNKIVQELRGLCAHCACGNNEHSNCPVQALTMQISSLRGVPLMVNNEFKGVLWGMV